MMGIPYIRHEKVEGQRIITSNDPPTEDDLDTRIHNMGFLISGVEL